MSEAHKNWALMRSCSTSARAIPRSDCSPRSHNYKSDVLSNLTFFVFPASDLLDIFPLEEGSGWPESARWRKPRRQLQRVSESKFPPMAAVIHCTVYPITNKIGRL